MTARQKRRRWLIPDSGQLQLVRPVLHGAAKEKLGRSHPMGVIVPSDGRELSCASLYHDVHGTNYPFLCPLPPGRELCVSCHGETIP